MTARTHDESWFEGQDRANAALQLTRREISAFLAATESVDAHTVVASIAQAVAPHGAAALAAVCLGAIRAGFDAGDALALATPETT